MYGSTDGGVITVTRTTDPVAKRRTTVGQPIPGGEVALRDPLGEPVPTGTAGEVTWRTPTKSFGYLNDDERTEAMFRGDGWFYSGDLGSLDEDGYLAITGRSKDLIIRGGQNISPLEIEQIGRAARRGVRGGGGRRPDPVFGERTCACVVLQPGVTALALDELTGYMRAQEIAPFKLPERLEIFAELPRTAGGKLSKVTLRSEVVERMAARQGGNAGQERSGAAGRGGRPQPDKMWARLTWADRERMRWLRGARRARGRPNAGSRGRPGGRWSARAARVRSC